MHNPYQCTTQQRDMEFPLDARITCAILFTFFSKHSCSDSLSPGRAMVGRVMPGRLPQKYRPRWAAEMSFASTTTGFACGKSGRCVMFPTQLNLYHQVCTSITALSTHTLIDHTSLPCNQPEGIWIWSACHGLSWTPRSQTARRKDVGHLAVACSSWECGRTQRRVSQFRLRMDMRWGTKNVVKIATTWWRTHTRTHTWQACIHRHTYTDMANTHRHTDTHTHACMHVYVQPFTQIHNVLLHTFQPHHRSPCVLDSQWTSHCRGFPQWQDQTAPTPWPASLWHFQCHQHGGCQGDES